MAQDELTAAPAGPGWWSRLGQLVSPGSSRPGTVPFLALVLAALAYAGSLGLDWISVSASLKRTPANSQLQVIIYGTSVTTGSNAVDITASNNVTGLELMGVVYGLGGLALLGLGFAALSRPDQALRLRMAVAGLGLGVLGVVIAAVLRLPKLLVANGAAYASGSLGEAVSHSSFQPGIFCAAALAVLPVVAVWIRSVPAARAAAAARKPAAPSAPMPATPAYDPSVWDRLYSDPGRWRRSGLPPPLDLTVTPDD